jgi:hypothetical protein
MAFSNSGENSSDITFSRTILPSCWYPVDMRTAVRSIYSTWKEQGGILYKGKNIGKDLSNILTGAHPTVTV